MLQGSTGAALVFRDELLLGLNHPLLAISAGASIPAVDLILQVVVREFGAHVVDRVVFTRGARTAAMVYLPTGHGSEERIIASDPRTGRVLGEITGVGLVPFVLFRLHDELLTGNVGHAI